MEKLTFGKKLIEFRKLHNLTQKDVAEKCNITVRTIQRIESGAVQPRATTIRIISQKLDFNDSLINEDHIADHNISESINNSTPKTKKLSNSKYKKMKIASITVGFVLTFIVFFTGFSKLKAKDDIKLTNTYTVTKEICDQKQLPLTKFTLQYPNGMEVNKNYSSNYITLTKKVGGTPIEELNIGYTTMTKVNEKEAIELIRQFARYYEKELNLKVITIGKKEFNGEMVYCLEGTFDGKDQKVKTTKLSGKYKMLLLFKIPEIDEHLNAVSMVFLASEDSEIKTFSDFATKGTIGKIYNTFKFIE
ncbi:helix-turn-helix domain-containing protein [Zhouia sp. PK063]|uniref:helix-turn-helix domain-containing protein n=1 Tax=Zhouia sp. PK063 TaxID=3373602 RepID=UPI0037BDD033